MTDGKTYFKKFTLSMPVQPIKFEKAFAAADGCNERIAKDEDMQSQSIMSMRSMRLVL